MQIIAELIIETYIAILKKFNYIFIGLYGILVATTSCKSINKLASKDVSALQQQNTKKSKQMSFIDNIEVAPGGVVAAKNNSIYVASNKKTKLVTSTSKNIVTASANNIITKTAIEDANTLQLKYALLLDATVEQLTNIDLLRNVDYWWGVKYCLGGSTENCIDCSAFTQIILKDAYGILLPRTAHEQYDIATSIDVKDLQEGDLVFFKTGSRGRRISHVGVYLLNHKFVHASTSNGVMISDLNDTYWQQHFKACGRVKAVNL